MQGIHENSGNPADLFPIKPKASLTASPVHHYFAASPFFDQTSNNAIVINQANYNINMQHFVHTRAAFEGRLKTMVGLEFMIAQEPAEMAPGTGTGVWVIRKQMRKKRPGYEDEIAVLASYFVVGENIYMAPLVGDVISCRVVGFESLRVETIMLIVAALRPLRAQ